MVALQRNCCGGTADVVIDRLKRVLTYAVVLVESTTLHSREHTHVIFSQWVCIIDLMCKILLLDWVLITPYALIECMEDTERQMGCAAVGKPVLA
jgi:hypothetical protein